MSQLLGCIFASLWVGCTVHLAMNLRAWQQCCMPPAGGLNCLGTELVHLLHLPCLTPVAGPCCRLDNMVDSHALTAQLMEVLPVLGTEELKRDAITFLPEIASEEDHEVGRGRTCALCQPMLASFWDLVLPPAWYGAHALCWAAVNAGFGCTHAPGSRGTLGPGSSQQQVLQQPQAQPLGMHAGGAEGAGGDDGERQRLRPALH